MCERGRFDLAGAVGEERAFCPAVVSGAVRTSRKVSNSPLAARACGSLGKTVGGEEFSDS